MKKGLTVSCVALSLLAGSFAAALGQSAVGTISGNVADEAGNPVAGARVFYTRIKASIRTPDGRFQDAPGEVNLSSVINTAADGTFTAANLPPGRYAVCADAPGFLSACEWSDPERIVVGAGQAVSATPVRLRRGAFLSIRVNDPLGLLPPENPLSNPLIIGVLDAVDSFRPAREVSMDTSGRTVGIVVPYSVPLRLWVHTLTLQVQDAAGTVVASDGSQQPFTVGPGQVPKAFTLNVIGPSPR